MTRKTNYQILKTKKQLADLVSLLYRYGKFCVDLETTSLKTHTEEIKIVGVGFSVKEGEAFYIPFNDSTTEFDSQYILDTIRIPLEDSSLGKIGQNIKYDYRVFNRFGINISNIVMDTMVASYCLYCDKFSHALDEMSLNHLGHIKIRTKSVLPKGKTMWDSPVEDVARYCCEDVDFTTRLANYYLYLFELPEYQYAKRLFYDIEIKITPILCQMECNGVKINTNILSEMREEVIAGISRLKKEIDTICGEEVVLTNNNQIGEILYNKLKIFDKRNIKVRKTKTGKLATNKKTLEKIKDEPVVEKILQVKTLNKLLSTYIEPIPLAVSNLTGFVHTGFHQHITNTGRLSSGDPINFQNQPSKNDYSRKIRSAFVSRFPGGKILSCDYSQQEMRIMAHLSGEPSLIKAYKENKDVHISSASLIYKVEESAVTKVQRDHTKVISYGLIYGMEAEKLSADLGISIDQAKLLMDRYLSNLTHVSNLLTSLKKFLMEHGYVETILGRRRFLTDVYSPIPFRRAAALREGPNMTIQGTAADTTKLAMIKLQPLLADKKTKLILQVHDELDFDLHPDELYLKDQIIEIMENALPISVPMKVDGKIADNWADAH